MIQAYHNNEVRAMKKFLFSSIFLLTSASFGANVDTAVISPMVAEAAAFIPKMKDVHFISKANRKYYIGYIGNKKVVVTISGMGKVNAAIATVKLIDDFHPQIILVEGTAGAINPHLSIGAVVVGKEVYSLERDRTELSHSEKINPENLNSLPDVYEASLDLLSKIGNEKNVYYPILFGKIATTDNFPNSINDIASLNMDKADVVEMEGSAVMQVCSIYKVACLVIRSNSNTAFTDSQNSVITKDELKISTANAADYAARIIPLL